MKKLFLILSLCFCELCYSQNTWFLNEETNEIQVLYVPWGTYDSNGVSILWQAKNRDALIDAVEEATGSSEWTPQIGDGFSIRITGVASNTGRLMLHIADDREVADWYGPLSSTYPTVQVVKDEPFVLEGVMIVDNVTHSCVGNKVEGGLTDASLFLAYSFNGESTDEGFNPEEPFTISDATMEIVFAEPCHCIAPPLQLTYMKQSDDSETYQYQSITQSRVNFIDVYDGAFINVEFTGTAISDMEKLMYMLADKSQKGESQYFSLTAYDVVTFAENIKSGDVVSCKFSYPLNKKNYLRYDEDGFIIYSNSFMDCIIGESLEKAVVLYFSDPDISVDVTERPKYKIPESIQMPDVDYAVPEDEIIVESERSEALFTMPIKDGADSYTLTIKNKGEIVCSLTFNAQGQLKNIDFSNTASYELKADVLAYQFTVTGLTEGTSYGYNFKALDNNQVVLKEYEGYFTTKNGEQIDDEGHQTAISEISNNIDVTIANRQIVVNGEVPAFVVTVLGQKIANANLTLGVYFVEVDGKTIGVSVW